MPRGELKVDADEVVATIETLIERGEVDKAGGGVASARLAAALEIDRETARAHCRRLANQGRLEAVWGVGPHGPRQSFVVPEGDDGE